MQPIESGGTNGSSWVAKLEEVEGVCAETGQPAVLTSIAITSRHALIFHRVWRLRIVAYRIVDRHIMVIVTQEVSGRRNEMIRRDLAESYR